MHATSHFRTQPTDLRANMKLQALVADLHSQAHLINTDIHDEEQRTLIFDVENVAYSTLARNLRTRLDKLLATIAMLESHLAEPDLAA